MSKIFSSLIFAILLAGCAVQPLPQDITGSNTAAIVARIRCEAREAIRLTAIKELELNPTTILYLGMNGTELASWLRTDLDRFNDLGEVKLKDEKLNNVFEYYKKSQVAYEFTLDLNESNTQGVDFDLARTFARRIDTLGFSAKGERTRQTKRAFKVIDNFYVLSSKINPEYCIQPRQLNIIYPIEGRLKILDLIDSFIFINKNGSFQGTPTGPAIPAMADTIIFSTKISGTLAPTVTLNPTGIHGFELSRFSVTNDNFREDKHQVIITATLPDLKNFPYYNGTTVKPFGTIDPRIIAAEDSIRQTRRNNVEDAIISLGSAASRFIQ